MQSQSQADSLMCSVCLSILHCYGTVRGTEYTLINPDAASSLAMPAFPSGCADLLLNGWQDQRSKLLRALLQAL